MKMKIEIDMTLISQKMNKNLMILTISLDYLLKIESTIKINSTLNYSMVEMKGNRRKI